MVSYTPLSLYSILFNIFIDSWDFRDELWYRIQFPHERLLGSAKECYSKYYQDVYDAVVSENKSNLQ